MNKKFLISEIFDNALIKYIESDKQKNPKLDVDIYQNIIKCLVFIYGDLDLVNPHITKDSKALIENMAKFGYSKDNINSFFEDFNNYDLFNLTKKLIDMFKCKKDVLELNEKYDLEFQSLLERIMEFEKNGDLFSYYKEKLGQDDKIEYLEIEPVYPEQTKKRKNFYFQMDAVNGFVSIMSILIFIAIICIGVIIINIIVG